MRRRLEKRFGGQQRLQDGCRRHTTHTYESTPIRSFTRPNLSYDSQIPANPFLPFDYTFSHHPTPSCCSFMEMERAWWTWQHFFPFEDAELTLPLRAPLPTVQAGLRHLPYPRSPW